MFQERHLYSVRVEDDWDQWLEDAWSEQENGCMPRVQGFIRGEVDGETQEAVKIAMAVHYIRGRTLDAFRKQAASKVKLDLVEIAIASGAFPSLTEAEIAALANIHSQRLQDTNQLWVETTALSYNRCLEIVEPWSVQRVQVELGGARFIIGDSPVVPSNGEVVSTLERPVALGDADRIFMPLSPTVVACLTQRPTRTEHALHTHLARQLNRASWEAAHAQVVARIEHDLLVGL